MKIIQVDNGVWKKYIDSKEEIPTLPINLDTDVEEGEVNKFYTNTEKTKLSGVEEGADVTGNHTALDTNNVFGKPASEIVFVNEDGKLAKLEDEVSLTADELDESATRKFVNPEEKEGAGRAYHAINSENKIVADIMDSTGTKKLLDATNRKFGELEHAPRIGEEGIFGGYFSTAPNAFTTASSLNVGQMQTNGLPVSNLDGFENPSNSYIYITCLNVGSIPFIVYRASYTGIDTVNRKITGISGTQFKTPGGSWQNCAGDEGIPKYSFVGVAHASAPYNSPRRIVVSKPDSSIAPTLDAFNSDGEHVLRIEGSNIKMPTGIMTGGKVQTASSGFRVVMDGSDNSLKVYNSSDVEIATITGHVESSLNVLQYLKASAYDVGLWIYQSDTKHIRIAQEGAPGPYADIGVDTNGLRLYPVQGGVYPGGTSGTKDLGNDSAHWDELFINGLIKALSALTIQTEAGDIILNPFTAVVRPNADDTVDLGSLSYSFKRGYFKSGLHAPNNIRVLYNNVASQTGATSNCGDPTTEWLANFNSGTPYQKLAGTFLKRKGDKYLKITAQSKLSSASDNIPGTLRIACKNMGGSVLYYSSEEIGDGNYATFTVAVDISSLTNNTFYIWSVYLEGGQDSEFQNLTAYMRRPLIYITSEIDN